MENFVLVEPKQKYLSPGELIEQRNAAAKPPNSGQGPKRTLLDGSSEEAAELERLYANLRSQISHVLCDRSDCLSLAVWDPDEQAMCLERKDGKLDSFGYTSNGRTYLHDFEALYLCELGRLQMWHNHMLMSLEQAYLLFFAEADSRRSVEYLVYAHLRRSGFILLPHRNERFEAGGSSKQVTKSECVWELLHSELSQRKVADYIEASAWFEKLKERRDCLISRITHRGEGEEGDAMEVEEEEENKEENEEEEEKKNEEEKYDEAEKNGKEKREKHQEEEENEKVENEEKEEKKKINDEEEQETKEKNEKEAEEKNEEEDQKHVALEKPKEAEELFKEGKKVKKADSSKRHPSQEPFSGSLHMAAEPSNPSGPPNLFEDGPTRDTSSPPPLPAEPRLPFNDHRNPPASSSVSPQPPTPERRPFRRLTVLDSLRSHGHVQQFEAIFRRFDVIHLRSGMPTTKQASYSSSPPSSSSSPPSSSSSSPPSSSLSIAFDLYLPRGPFRRSSPGPPAFRVAIVDASGAAAGCHTFPCHRAMLQCFQRQLYPTPVLLASVGESKQIQAFLFHVE